MSHLAHNYFLQLDTRSLIAYFQEKGYDGSKADPNVILSHTMFFNQGSMSLGATVSKYVVDIELDGIINFSVLPLELFTGDRLYFFTDESKTESDRHVPFSVKGLSPKKSSKILPVAHIDQYAVSFCTRPAEVLDEPCEFSFQILLVPTGNTIEDPVNTGKPGCNYVFNVDPQLKVGQGNN